MMRDKINPQALSLPALLLCLLTLPCCTGASGEILDTPLGQPQASVVSKPPNFSWVPIYFESINERASLANLPDLPSAAQAEGDVEVRLWMGFGLVPLEGVVIRRQGGVWSGTHLKSINPALEAEGYEQALPEPKDGWDNYWARITELGVQTLPDDSQLPRKWVSMDGKSFVVEVKVNNSYRTYKYSGAQHHDWPEGKQMLEIASFTFDQFGIER